MNSVVNQRKYVFFPLLFALVIVIGLFIVKWNPYYAKAFVAAAKHNIGNSIIASANMSIPTPSWSAVLPNTTTAP